MTWDRSSPGCLAKGFNHRALWYPQFWGSQPSTHIALGDTTLGVKLQAAPKYLKFCSITLNHSCKTNKKIIWKSTKGSWAPLLPAALTSAGRREWVHGLLRERDKALGIHAAEMMMRCQWWWGTEPEVREAGNRNWLLVTNSDFCCALRAALPSYRLLRLRFTHDCEQSL